MSAHGLVQLSNFGAGKNTVAWKNTLHFVASWSFVGLSCLLLMPHCLYLNLQLAAFLPAYTLSQMNLPTSPKNEEKNTVKFSFFSILFGVICCVRHRCD